MALLLKRCSPEPRSTNRQDHRLLLCKNIVNTMLNPVTRTMQRRRKKEIYIADSTFQDLCHSAHLSPDQVLMRNLKSSQTVNKDRSSILLRNFFNILAYRSNCFKEQTVSLPNGQALYYNRNHKMFG